MKKHSIEHIKERANYIQNYLESHYDGDLGNVISERLTEVAAYMAESGKLKADADYHYKLALNGEIINTIKNMIPDYTSANVQNKLINSLCAELYHLVIMTDRINASCTHQLDVMRTQLSYLKNTAK